MPKRSIATQGRTPATHKAYLEGAFGPYAGAADQDLIEYMMASCRALISSGVRVEGGVDFAFAVRTYWRDPPAMRALFAEYVASGLVDINSDAKGGLPVENAIVYGNVQALELFLFHGADLTRVPSRAWKEARERQLAGAGAPPPKRPEPPILDVCEFARRHCRVKETRPAIIAILRAALMSRQIEESVISTHSDACEPSNPPRGAGSRAL
ncbi:hypothetical protein ABIC83_002507 [Roseateles asaccharophilus]|uniref:hypothetical protein n=1 Tax=Roseateles asaccharophilus TaxID=582607 RepID=UPI0038398FDD